MLKFHYISRYLNTHEYITILNISSQLVFVQFATSEQFFFFFVLFSHMYIFVFCMSLFCITVRLSDAFVLSIYDIHIFLAVFLVVAVSYLY